MIITYRNMAIVLVPFLVVLSILIGFSYIEAQVWTSPTATPPASNTRAPINVGVSAATIQSGAGALVFNRFAATGAVWSDSYCDAVGGNCFSPATGPVVPNPTCVNRSSGIGGNSASVSCLAGEVAMSGGCLDTCSGLNSGNCSDKAIHSSAPTANGWSCTVSNRAQATVRCCTF